MADTTHKTDANTRKLVIVFPTEKVNTSDYSVVLDVAENVSARVQEPTVKGAAPAAPVNYQWIASAFTTLNFTHEQKHAGLAGPRVTVDFPKALEGGGLAWLEPFAPGSEPTNHPPNGYFISAKGTPKIVSAEWREYAADNNGPIITSQTRHFGQRVQLHVYTEGLYGHPLQVYLKDHDHNLLDPDDDLPEYTTGNSSKPAIKSGYFSARVSVYKALPDEQKGKANPQGIVPIQKAIVNVFLDDAWIDSAGSSLEVYSLITAPDANINQQSLQAKLLYVNDKGHGNEDREQSNKPVLVGDVPTSAADFHPCKYTAVLLVTQMKNNKTDKDEDKKVYLYKEKETVFRNFEIVAGPKKGAKKVTIELENLKVNEQDCKEPQGHKHKSHVLTLVQWPETSSKGVPGAKEKKEEKSKWTVPLTQESNMLGVKTTQTHVVSMEPTVLEVLEATDSKLSFKAKYMYDMSPITLGGLNVHPIFRYFWMGNNVAGKAYIVEANTCRHKHAFSIIPYPDVKWKLAFEYTVAKSKITAIGTATYRNAPEKKWEKVGDNEMALSLEAEWDGQEKLSLSEDFKESIKKQLARFSKVADYLQSAFLGQQNTGSNDAATQQNRQTLEEAKRKFEASEADREKDRKAAEKLRDNLSRKADALGDADKDSKEYRDLKKGTGYLQKKMDKDFAKLKRDVVGIDIIKPSINLSFGWSRADTNFGQRDEFQNRTGMLLEGTLEAKPIIGISAYLDFLGLLQRAHPIALAVIAVADLSLKLIGDGSKITCELRGTGQLGGKLQGFLNTLTKENSFNGNDRAVNDKKAAELTGDLSFSLKIELKMVVKKHMICVSVIGEGTLSAEATAKWSAKAVIDADDKGYYAKFSGRFEGLEIVGKAEANFKAEDGDAESLFSYKTGGQVKYQAIDKQPEKEWGTLHFGNS